MITGLIVIVISLLVIWLAIHKINKVELDSDQDQLKLPIELVPLTMHGFNVRSRLSKEQWTGICNVAHGRYSKRPQLCEICNEDGKNQGFTHSLECHEKWEYDSETKTQRLVGLRSICPLCHKVFHYGLAEKKGYGEKALNHFIKVNKLKPKQAEEYIQKSKAQIKQRSKIDWQLDLTYLNQKQFNFLKISDKRIVFTDKEKYNCKFYEF